MLLDEVYLNKKDAEEVIRRSKKKGVKVCKENKNLYVKL